jgi:hypothetical protein
LGDKIGEFFIESFNELLLLELELELPWSASRQKY